MYAEDSMIHLLLRTSLFTFTCDDNLYFYLHVKEHRQVALVGHGTSSPGTMTQMVYTQTHLYCKQSTTTWIHREEHSRNASRSISDFRNAYCIKSQNSSMIMFQIYWNCLMVHESLQNSQMLKWHLQSLRVHFLIPQYKCQSGKGTIHRNN